MQRFTVVVIVGWVAAGGCTRLPVSTKEVHTAVYVRTDSDDTTIASPGTRARFGIGEAWNVDANYAVDAWTGASIDVVTAATTAIHEVRQEAVGALAYERDEWNIGGSYRHSHEPDYTSNSGILTFGLDWNDHNSQLNWNAFGGVDNVGRAGDPQFDRRLGSLGARVSLVQVLGRRTIASVSWESTALDGYQASPYRFVAIGDEGTCSSQAPYCVPERVPSNRVRHAAVFDGRRALGPRLSLGIRYRFYADSWELRSHTVTPDMGLRIGDHGVLTWSYRYYTQAEASFYRPRYFGVEPSGGYITRDRKLSAFLSQALGAEYRHTFPLDPGGFDMVAGLRATGSRIHYLGFVGLEYVHVLEITGSLGVVFR